MPRRWSARAGLLVLAAAALVILARSLPDTAPDGDFALIDIQVRNVFREWLGVGPYSRLGGFHPGPLYFQTLAPLGLLADYRHAASVLTVLVINVASLWGIVRILSRQSTHALLVLSVAVVFGLYLWRVDGLLTSVWNPHVGVLPALLTLIAAAAVASRAAVGYLPAAVIAGSFAVQAHVSFAVPVSIALAAVVIALLASARVRAEVSRRPGLLTGACLLAAVVWAMPVADEFRSGGHDNLSRIVRFAAESTPHDVRQAARAFEHLVVSPFTPGLQLWDVPVPPSTSTVRTIFNILIVLVLAAALWFHRQRQWFELALTAVVIVAAGGGLLAMRRFPEPVHSYTVFWITALGAMMWSAILAAVLGALRVQLPARAFGRTPAIVAAAVALVVLATQVSAQSRRDLARTPPTLTLAGAVAERVQQAESPPHFRLRGGDLGPTAGVVLALDKKGLQPTVDLPMATMFGTRFRAATPPRLVFELADFDRHFEDLKHRANYVRLASAERTVLYQVAAAPALDEHPISVREIQRSPGVKTERVGESEDWLVFAGAGEFVDWEGNLSRAAALELSGWRDSNWQIRCVSSGEATRIGRVPIAEGESSGAVFLRALPSCPTIRISPVDGAGESRLKSVRVLGAK